MRIMTLAACAMLAAARANSGPAPWIEVKSAHFTVIANSGDSAGRRVAWQFEQIRSGLSSLWPWAKVDGGRPFLVFAAKDEATLKALGPEFWEGKRYRPTSFWTTGRDRHFVALRTDIQEPDGVSVNPYQTAYWSYAHAIFTRTFPRRLPEWYARGIAGVMSNTFVRGKQLDVGRLMQGNINVMRERAPIPLAEFLAADRRSRWLVEETGLQLFDAQAWALVHYLMFGEEGRNAARVDQFNRLLYEGTAEDVALREAFGDMTPYYEGMRSYVTRRVFGYARVPVSLDLRAEGFTSRVLSPAEAAVLRGKLHVAMGRPVEARALAAEAAKADPTLPGPWEIEAALLDTGDHREEARAAYTKAVEAGSESAHAYYRLAQLEWASHADRALQEKLAARLEQARQLDPAYADALSFLAEVRSSLGQLEDALNLATQAVQAEPAVTYHRLVLARILWSLQRPDDAVRAAESAMKTADSESEKQQVQEFLAFAARSRP
ncbi:MAG TPA: tetratricopeptide repeat protein [Vicinamibacteria bacterium]|nr:tetratricopeptide repeat protein [Vicinamibacteria bacterium]